MRIVLLLSTLAMMGFGQVSLPNAAPFPNPEIQFLDSAGAPLAGSKLCSYAAGTSTPLATYTDSTAGTPNSNPIVLDSAGRASVWVGPKLYKFVLRTGGTSNSCNNGSIVWTQDNVADSTLYFTNYVKTVGTATLISYTNPATGAVQRTAQSKFNDALSVKDFGAVCDGSTDDYAAFVLALAQSSLTQAIQVPDGTCAIGTGLVIDHAITLIGNAWVLKYAGGGATDAVLKLVGGPESPHGALMQGSTIQGVVFDGGNQAAAGLQLQAVVSAQVNYARVINTTAVGFLWDWAQQVQCEHCQVSKDFDGAATIPPIGVKIAGISSANVFISLNVDHTSSHGVELDYALNTTFIGGTSEGVGGYGVYCPSVLCFNNVFYNFDTEANTSGDYYFGSGAYGNSVIQGNSFSHPGVVLAGSAHHNSFIGGQLGGASTAGVNTFGNSFISMYTTTLSGPVLTDDGQNFSTRIYNQFNGSFIEPSHNYQATETWGNTPAATQKMQIGTPLPNHVSTIWGDVANNWIGFDCQDGFPSCWLTYPNAGGIQFIGETAPDTGAINDGAIKGHKWCFGRFNNCSSTPSAVSFDFYDQGSGHGTTVGVRAETGQGGNDLMRWYGYDAVTPPVLSFVDHLGAFNGATSGAISGTSTIPGTVGHAVCVKSDHTIGTCTSVVSSSGTCTCS